MTVVTTEPAPSWRPAALWLALALTLTLATMTAPGIIAEWSAAGDLSVAGLGGAVSRGFEQWVGAGTSAPTPGLTQAVSFWTVFHAAKAVISAALLVVVIGVGCRLWLASARSRTVTGRVLWSIVGLAGAGAPVLVLLVVLANVQGAFAPLSSVLTFLPDSGSPAVDQVRSELAAGSPTAVTTALIEDFRTYHAVLAVCLILAMLGLIAATVLMWVRRARLDGEDRRLRRLLAAGGLVTPLLLPALGLLLLANLSTVADTSPALVAFFDGGGM